MVFFDFFKLPLRYLSPAKRSSLRQRNMRVCAQNRNNNPICSYSDPFIPQDGQIAVISARPFFAFHHQSCTSYPIKKDHRIGGPFMNVTVTLNTHVLRCLNHRFSSVLSWYCLCVLPGHCLAPSHQYCWSRSARTDLSPLLSPSRFPAGS